MSCYKAQKIIQRNQNASDIKVVQCKLQCDAPSCHQTVRTRVRMCGRMVQLVADGGERTRKTEKEKREAI
jgi:hypothetical protein